MERTVHIDKNVYTNLGGKVIPQQYIQVENKVFYLQDRQHFNGLRVFADRQTGKNFCVIGRERIIVNGYRY